MRTVNKKQQNKVVRYSAICQKQMRPKTSRLTLQEIELHSYSSSNDEWNEPTWSVQFRPKIRELLASSASTGYSSARSFAAHTTTSLVGASRNTIDRSSDKITDVLTLPKNGMQSMIDIGVSSISYFKRVIANTLAHLKYMLEKGKTKIQSLGNHATRIMKYLYANLVLIMLIVFISIVCIITLLQTTSLIINLFSA